MREIRFRAWHETAKQMFFENAQGDVFKWKNEGQPVIIEQFTGLLDKNGKEVYEGDIVKFEDVSGYKDGCASVIWHEDSCGYYLENDDDNIYDTLYDFTPSYQMEVIGNIHENPELLEGRE